MGSYQRVGNAGLLDSLTGLSNRAVFVEGLGRRLDDCRNGRAGRFALLYLDLDRFKVVNDSLGHLVGDELLIAVSRRLESCVRPGDALARLGGDEFAILVSTLAEDWMGLTLSAPTNIAFFGPQLDRLAAANIAFQHLAEIATDMRGAPLRYPVLPA